MPIDDISRNESSIEQTWEDRAYPAPSRTWVAASAVMLMVASLGAALLPRLDAPDWAFVVGSMLVLAGAFEILGGMFRPTSRIASIAPGVLTVVTGAIAIQDLYPALFPLTWLVIGWMAMRGVVLLWTSSMARGTVRRWTLIAAGKEFLFVAILVIGVSSMTLPGILFDPSGYVAIGFAATLAFSFILTAMLLIEVAYRDFEEPSSAAREATVSAAS